jgi:hypothetical protein
MPNEKTVSNTPSKAVPMNVAALLRPYEVAPLFEVDAVTTHAPTWIVIH